MIILRVDNGNVSISTLGLLYRSRVPDGCAYAPTGEVFFF